MLASTVSLLVVAAIFVALLGGTHPPDRTRDLVLVASVALFTLLNIPSALAIARRQVAVPGSLLALLARVGFAAIALHFIHGTSHEGRHDAWRACRTRIGLGGVERCSFLHLCANEAPLSAAERALLARRIRATPGLRRPVSATNPLRGGVSPGRVDQPASGGGAVQRRPTIVTMSSARQRLAEEQRAEDHRTGCSDAHPDGVGRSDGARSHGGGKEPEARDEGARGEHRRHGAREAVGALEPDRPRGFEQTGDHQMEPMRT